MPKLSPSAKWEFFYSIFVKLPHDEQNVVSDEYHRLKNLPEHQDSYNHEIMEMALRMITPSFSMSDAADEYERYERAEEIIRGL